MTWIDYRHIFEKYEIFPQRRWKHDFLIISISKGNSFDSELARIFCVSIMQCLTWQFSWRNDFYSFYPFLPYFQYELYWSCLVDIRIFGSINCLLFTFEWFLTLFICIGMHFECMYVSNGSYLFIASRFMLYIDRKKFKIMQINGANLCYLYEQWIKFCWFNYISDTLFDWIGQNGSEFSNHIEKNESS